MSSFFWNSGPTGPPNQAPPPAWGGWGGMYQGPHGIQGAGGVPGGAVPPHVLPWVQNLLNAQQGGPMDRINTGGLPPFWQQIGLSAAPVAPNGGAYGNGVALSGDHSPLSNPTGTGLAGGPPRPNPNPGSWNPGGGNTAGNPGEGPNPAAVSAFQNYVMSKWPGYGGGWNGGPPGSY